MPNPEEYRRTRRIIDLLLRIANQPRRWTRRALAERYEVSEQQIDKDLHLLRHGLVMPLRHCRDGYYFERLATLPGLALSLPEALSLLLAARLGQQMPGISQPDLSAAIARLETLLPAELLPVVRALGHAGPAGSPDSLLLELQLAVAEGSRLRLLYRSASRDGAALERLVDPYTLVPYARSWYLVGFCHLRGEPRIFKVDRIQRAERTGERFDFPAEFDLGSYLGGIWGLLRGEAGEVEEVVLEFEPEAGRWVRDQEWHPAQRVEELADGRVRVSFRLAVTSDLRRFVLGFGRQVRVVSPAALAEWVREEARGMVGWDGRAKARP